MSSTTCVFHYMSQYVKILPSVPSISLCVCVPSYSLSFMFLIFQVSDEVLPVFEAYPSLLSVLFPTEDLVFTFDRRSRTVLSNSDKSLQIQPRPDVCDILDVYASVNRELLPVFDRLIIFEEEVRAPNSGDVFTSRRGTYRGVRYCPYGWIRRNRR